MKKHAESHLDHGLTSAQISYLLGIEVPEGVVTVRTVELPKALGGLPCALYGPLMGDPPLAYDECRFGQRGNRKGLSRLIDRPPRTTRLVTFVAGPHDGLEGVLFTAYGGPAAPREPWEVPDDADAAAFWSEHALAAPRLSVTKVAIALLRSSGIRERMDLVLYDTYTIEPGQRERFFRNANIGYVHRTNLQIAGQFGDRTFVVTSIGLRLLGKTRDEEDLLLDHLHLQFNIGDHSMATVMGPHASMLQHVYRADELAGEEQTANIPPAWALLKALAEAHGYKRQPEDEMPHPEDAAVILDWLEERGIGNIDKIKGDVRFRAPRTGVGYVLARPLIIPVRQNFSAEIDASPRLSEAVLARVHLFGLSVQDVA